MKTVKSQKLMMINRCYEEGQRRALFIGVGVAFFLDNPANLVAEKTAWTAIAQHVKPPAIFDAGFPKPASEILAAGNATAPGGNPVRGLLVTTAVGAVRRRLAVFGNRTWQRHGSVAVFSEPEPFLSIPLLPTLAYGGPGVAENPGGIGHGAAAQLAANLNPPLPNIEDADHQLRTIADTPAPAIPGPIDLMAPSRQQYAGTYDSTWLKKQHPGFPTDVNATLFHAAQPPQRLPGQYFTGQEGFEVAGMHADHPVLTGTLPDLRPRAFLKRAGEPLREVELRCETVWLLGSALIGVVLWRGQAAVAEQEAADVEAIMLAGERFADDPAPIDQYRDQFTLRTDKATAGLHALNDRGIMPAPTPDAETRKQAARSAARAELIARQQRTMAWGRKQVMAQIDPALHPLIPAFEPSPPPDDLPLVTQHDLETGDVDLAAIVEFARKKADEARALKDTGKDLVQKAAATKSAFRAIAQGETPDPDATLTPDAVRAFQKQFDEIGRIDPVTVPDIDALLGAHAPPGLADKVKALPADPAAMAHQAIADILAKSEAPPEDDWDDVHRRVFGTYRVMPEAAAKQLEASLDQAATAVATATQQGTASLAEAAARIAPHDQATAEKLAAISLTDPPPAPPGGIDAILDEILAVKLPSIEGAPPAQMDQAQAALDEALAGTKALFGEPAMQAALAMAKNAPPAKPMDTAAMKQDVQARLQEADAALSAGMAKANQARRVSPRPIAPAQPVSDASAVRLGALAQDRHRNAEPLTGLDFAGIAAPGASFTQALAAESFWEKGALSGADFTAANLVRGVFAGADLSRAEFANADLTGANFGGAWLARAGFARAVLENAVLSEADLSAANLTATRFNKSVMIKGKLVRATLAHAVIRNCIFVDTDWTEADWSGARFEKCMFIRSTLTGIRAPGVSMTRCAFVQSNADGIDFSGARLERTAALGGSSFRAATLVDAQAAGTTWMKTDLSGADLSGADFSKATMMGAQLPGARLVRTRLRKTLLGAAILTDADLRDADLFEAMLRKTDFRLADLRGANLYSADLAGAVLHFANLTHANLNITLLAQATDAA